ncbi:MAG: cell division protein FtsZ [Candidatus Lambdaproteobacteria bacterium]|nr:cell division protein FtsZ [Candidatus Lambdaproteobacteria bacterium]
MGIIGIEQIREVGQSTPVVLKVVGVGGGGGNAVNRMIGAGVGGVEFVVANTDLQDLGSSLAPNRLQLGSRLTRGLGAGAKPEIGRESALENLDAIRDHLQGADMVFITAGMGGGTGTGAAPVIAEVARELGSLTVAVVTKPFKFEGKVRARNCDEGILQLRKHVDTLIVIPNDNLLLLANKKTSIVEAFTMADDVLRVAIQGISDLISKEGLINLDFADVQTVMANRGQAIMGMGVGNGENRAVEAAEKAIHSPLLDDCRIDGAKGILINVTGSSSMGLHEVYEAASFIEDHADDDATIIFGASIDDSLDDRVEITVIATGFGPSSAEPVRKEKDAERGARGRSAFKVYSTPAAEPLLSPAAVESIAEAVAAAPPAAAREEDVFELRDPIMEPVETKPQFPSSYRPEEKHGGSRKPGVESDLDIPTFIRRRSSRLSEE